MDTQRLYQLLEAYAARAASPEEEQELFGLLDAGPEPDIKGVLRQLQEATAPDPAAALDTARWQPVLDSILAMARTLEPEGEESTPDEHTVDQPPIHRRFFPWTRIAAAAAVIGLLAAGTWFWTHRPGPNTGTTTIIAKTDDVAPGGNRAILTLAGGSTIVLDSAHDGQLASQGNTTIVKSGSEQLAYNTAQGRPTAVAFNTLTTPRGGVYRLILPDGTKVWLNAASAITYPTAFSGPDREVSITGEAYFEVAKNPRQPFRVKVNDADIDVLGTSFNINAYNDEPTARTTLLSGAVRVGRLILQPGQQASDDRGGRVDLVPHADIDQAVAWKNGLFQFKSAPIGSLMRQLARWYDIQVAYPGGEPQGHITGKLPRDMSLAKLEKALEFSGVHFTIDGNKINVAP